MPLRLASLVVLAALVGASPLAARTETPRVLHRGQVTAVSAGTGTITAACTATLRYANGSATRSRPVRPRNHRVIFVVRVSKTAALGAGRWQISCGRVVASGSFVVATAATKTIAAAPHIDVVKQGFSQRPASYGTNSDLSYGLLLQNTSPTEDAEGVYLIVNMVDANGALLGSMSQTIGVIPAGGTFAVGNSIALRTQTPVASLELTITVGAHEPKLARTMPDFANVHLVPSTSDTGWLGEVDGEIDNDTGTHTLLSARLSVVVLDGAGNPIGGGTGYSTSALPPGARYVFTAQTGFTAIPLDQAASALVSAEPTYATN